MADTITTYIGNGTQTDFSIPFDYLKKSFVRVYVDSVLLTGGDYGDTTVDYYFLDKTTVRLKTPPAENIEVTIRRYTSATERIVSFEDASILKATDLDTSQLQSFHIAEEARDIINDALVKDPDGNWDALGNRITNVGDPVDGKDAINLDWYNEDAGRVQANADLTEQWKDETKGYRDEAEGFRNESEQSASQAQASADIAVSSSSKAEAAYNKVVVLEEQVESNAQQVDQQSQQVNQQSTTVNNQYNQIQEWTEENRVIHEDVTQKHSEVTDMYNTVVEKADAVVDASEEIKIVANNIEDVKTTATNIEDVNIVAGDLEGSIDVEGSTDMGMVGDPESPSMSITGGNIKTVADNIEDVQKVGDLIDSGQVDTVINAVETTAENVTKAKQSEDNAKVSEGLAKDWAVKTDGLVNNEDYSAKYYAQQAKTSADSTAGSAFDIEETITQAKQDISTAVTQGVSQISSTGSTAVSNINDAKDQATENLETVTQAHLSEITSAGSTQVQAVNTAGTTQVGLVEAKGTAQVTRVEDAGDAQVEAIESAGTTHLNEINTAGTTQTKAVNTAGTTQTKAVNDAGSAQVGLVKSEGAKQVAAVSLEGTNQTSAVNSAGQAQLATINVSVQKAKDWAEKTDGEVEAGAYSAKYWAQQASTVAGQSDWSEPNDSSPAFIKNKPDLSIYALKTEISTIYRYKGTVATYDQLPIASQAIGDAYNVASDDKSHGIKAGDNVVWNGTYWDNLSGYVDLSPYLTNEAASGIYLRQDTASTTYATKASLSSYATKTELSSYALKTEIPDVSGYQTKTQHDADIQELTTEIGTKANSDDVYTKTEVYTKSQVDSKITESIITDYGLVGS